jgi:hypothetical protein
MRSVSRMPPGQSVFLAPASLKGGKRNVRLRPDEMIAILKRGFAQFFPLMRFPQLPRCTRGGVRRTHRSASRCLESPGLRFSPGLSEHAVKTVLVLGLQPVSPRRRALSTRGSSVKRSFSLVLAKRPTSDAAAANLPALYLIAISQTEARETYTRRQHPR